jgi:crotonobetainyl-CoA:carnitine CoA-transferase CaiB-like acyl-CoA transferase
VVEDTGSVPAPAATADGPLSGLLVADFSRVLAGPYASMLLADLGADVVKVESPTGDDTRTWMPPIRDGVSSYGLQPVVVVVGEEDAAVPSVRNPVTFSATPASYRLPPPELDEHGEELRKWLAEPR